jgi:GNAT superfamily N-acetyltransferase
MEIAFFGKGFPMDQAIQVRVAQWGDAEVLAALSYEFNHVQVTSNHVLSRLSSSFHTEIVVVGEVDGQVVGFACAQILESICYSKPWAELTELFVQERYRRRGLGRGLVRMVEQMAHREGATDLLVHTNAVNLAGQALYQSMGYEMESHVSLKKELVPTE